LKSHATPDSPGKAPALRVYLERLRAFSPNARLYLVSIMIFGAAMGINQLLFNFYVLSLGFNEAVLGNLVTARSAASLVAALPMGYLTDRIGRKNAFIAGTAAVALSSLMMVVFPSVAVFTSMNLLLGVAQSLSAVAMGPFLMENSGEKERTYLFSYASGLRMTATSIGEWMGGTLPAMFASMVGVSAVSPQAYQWALGAMVLLTLLSLLPNLLMTENRQPQASRAVFAPVSYMKNNPGKLGKLIIPSLIISIGAGMIMPFMNVFFRTVHHQTDAAIGVLFAWGSLAMGIGLMIAPALAEKFGKIEIVVATQALSIPFLALLGFSPWFGVSLAAYYIRLTLMNMSGPVYSTFVLERVDPNSRAMVASLTNMASTFGWAFSPTISGYLQLNYGFGPAFLVTIVTYILATWMYFAWFWRKAPKPGSALAAEPEAIQTGRS
jgi:MFS family permease